MVKLTVEQFRLVRKEFQKLIEDYQGLAEANKDNPDFDEEKEQQIVLNKYVELQTDLLNYDLSEIPFEEWANFVLITEDFNLENALKNVFSSPGFTISNVTNNL